MNSKNILQYILLLPLFISGQNYINGTVIDNKAKPLINASVNWMGDYSIGTITDENGNFRIKKTEDSNKKLIISFIGFKNDTIDITENDKKRTIQLENLNDLETINISTNRENTYIDKSSVIKTEVITKKELTKAACCDLAGCFETQISVEPKTTNIITNTKELSILGLSGVYNQLLINGLPILNAANYTYGISAIPGTLIEKIYISQGLASILQGHESITGQINIVLKEKQDENLFVNLYINSFLSKQLNFDYNFNLGKWKSIISLHSTQPSTKIDNNNDNFLDLPQTKKYSLYNNWVYSPENNSNLYTHITLRYLIEERIGGEMNYDATKDQGSNQIYGQTINFTQPEIHVKSTYNLNSNSELILQSALSKHNQESFFGTTEYLIDQLNYYINLGHVLKWKTHELKSGISFKKLKINENIILNDNWNKSYGGEYQKNEEITGLFLENIFRWGETTELMTGFRIDNHNEYGFITTPRILLKYNFTENSILRFSLGKGWRTINIFSENIQLFGTNQDIIISNNLEPERGVNIGGNLLQSLYFKNIELQFTLDFYKTLFSNQISPDYHSSPNEIIISNFKGKSISNSFQIEMGVELHEEIGVKIAYNFLDVFKIIENHKHQLPFIAKHHILHTFSYQPLERNWQIDLNLHWFGSKQLIDTTNNPSQYQRENTSNPYTIFNSQFTKKFTNWELYIGCENIFNIKQENPIISAENPFSEYFSVLNIWGPIKGRELYVGCRIKL